MSGNGSLADFRRFVSEVAKNHSVEVMAKRDGDLAERKGLFGDYLDGSLTGNFYEELHRSLHGYSRAPRTFEAVDPDFISPHCLGDVKACYAAKDIHFRPYQLRGYLMASETLGIGSYHVFYLHSSSHGRSSGRDVSDLLDSLANGTLMAIHVPSSLLVRCCQRYLGNSEDNLVRFSNRTKRGFWAYVSSKGVRMLISEPLEFVRAIGGNSDDYAIHREISPRDFKIGVRAINQFPILRIEDMKGFDGLKVPDALLAFDNGFNKTESPGRGLFDDGFDSSDTR